MRYNGDGSEGESVSEVRMVNKPHNVFPPLFETAPKMKKLIFTVNMPYSTYKD